MTLPKLMVFYFCCLIVVNFSLSDPLQQNTGQYQDQESSAPEQGQYQQSSPTTQEQYQEPSAPEQEQNQQSYPTAQGQNQESSAQPTKQSYSIFWILPGSHLVVGFIDISNKSIMSINQCITKIRKHAQYTRQKVDKYIKSLPEKGRNMNVLKESYDSVFTSSAWGCVPTFDVPTYDSTKNPTYKGESLTKYGYGGYTYSSYYIQINNFSVTTLQSFNNKEACYTQYFASKKNCFDYTAFGSKQTFELIRLALLQIVSKTIIDDATNNN